LRLRLGVYGLLALATNRKEKQMTNYSKGPWRVGSYQGQHDEAGGVILDANGKVIATTWGGLRHNSPPEDWQRYHSDAHLLAAAPALFEALKAARDHLEYIGYGDSWERGVALDSDGSYAQHGGLDKMIESAIAEVLNS
jgi:hypothetical protein